MNLITIILIAFCIVLTIKNLKQLKTSKVESFYLEAYKALIANKENTMELIDKCINESKGENEIKKAYVLKLIEAIKLDQDYSEVLNKISPELFFYKNDALDSNLLLDNSDVYVWLITAMVKAYSKDRQDVIKALYEKFNNRDSELNNNLEYQVFVAAHNVLVNEGDHSFLTKLNEGDYADYNYDKRVVGSYKRISGVLMYHAKDAMDEYLTKMLHDYSKSILGSYLLTDMGYINDFEEKEEVVEEEKKDTQE